MSRKTLRSMGGSNSYTRMQGEGTWEENPGRFRSLLILSYETGYCRQGFPELGELWLRLQKRWRAVYSVRKNVS